MKYWPGHETATDPAFDAALRLRMLEGALIATVNNPAGNFFDASTVLEEQIETDEIEGEAWDYCFGGKSWLPNSSTYSVMTIGESVFVEPNPDITPTKFELYLEARCRTPLKVDKHDQRLWNLTDVAKLLKIKRCERYAIDTLFRYQINGPKFNGVHRTASWSLMGIMPGLMGDIRLSGKKYNPIRNPNPLRQYFFSGPIQEATSGTTPGKKYKKNEREFSIFSDQLRVQGLLAALGWSAIEAHF